MLLQLTNLIIIKQMGKIDKKRKKLQDRIDFLNEQMRLAITQKSSNSVEINVGKVSEEIKQLNVKLQSLK